MDACIKVQGLLSFLVGVGIKPRVLLDKRSATVAHSQPLTGGFRQVLNE